MSSDTIIKSVQATGVYPYSSIIRQMKQRIVDGEWKPNEKIPSEKSLAAEFEVCHATMKKALKELEREGIMWAHRGRGRFVSDQQSRKKTWTIGVILLHLQHLNHPTKQKQIEGINKILAETSYHLNVHAINMSSIPSTHPEQNERWHNAVSPSTLDGAIIIPREMPTEMVDDLATNIPVVWMDHASVRDGLAGVREDYTGAPFRAIKHLTGLGHRRIAMISVNEKFEYSLRGWDGFRLALEELDPADRENCTYIKAEDFTEAEGMRATKDLLNSDKRPTAIVCCSDELTSGAYKALREARLDVPDDISLVGWNSRLGQSDIPIELTSVEMNYKQAGMVAAKRMLELIDTPTRWFDSEFIPSELFIGKSTKPIEPSAK
jgi:GntR family transcriptional regulator, arabinose operon transcriptional repressor